MPDFLKEGSNTTLPPSVEPLARSDIHREWADSTVFVNDVFEAIAYKSYLPGAPPPKGPASLPGLQLPGLTYDDAPIPNPPIVPSQNGSKKRSYADRGDGDGDKRMDRDIRGRAFKSARRSGGRGGRTDDTHGYKAPIQAGFHYGPSTFPPVPPGVPQFDAFALTSLMQMASNLSSQGAGGVLGPSRKRGRCRDYDTKGYCSRGSSCMYEHGDDSMFLAQGFGAPTLPQPVAIEGFSFHFRLLFFRRDTQSRHGTTWLIMCLRVRPYQRAAHRARLRPSWPGPDATACPGCRA
jgi:RNA-binding protein 26